MKSNPRTIRIKVGLRFCPKCGIVTYGQSLPECRGKVMWANSGGHPPRKTEWVK